MDGVDDVDDVDDVNPKLLLYDSLRGERENFVHVVHVVQRKTHMPHLKDRDRLGVWAFGKFYIFGSKDSDRSGGRAIGKSGIRPLNNPSICDRPPRLTHTHTSNNTTYIMNMIKPLIYSNPESAYCS